MMIKYLFKFQSTLKRQLIGFLVSSIILLALVTSIITSLQSSEKLKISSLVNGQRIASNFADQSLLALITASQENAKEAMDRTLGFEMVKEVAIFNFNNESIAKSENSKISPITHDAVIDLMSVLVIKESKMDWLIAAPVFLEDEALDTEMVEPEETTTKQFLGYVVIKFDKTELIEIQKSIFMSNILTSILIAIVLVIIINWGINRLVEPLTALSNTMRVARDSGGFIKAEINGAVEIRQMASVFNQMMSRLEKQNIELERHRDTLESEVEVRTQELKVARDTALTASRHKSEFLANISHELRTPLQAVIGYTDLVREELDLEGMVHLSDDLGKSIRSAHHLLSLINNILDLAKIEAGRMDLYIQSVDMNYLINDALETIRPMAESNANTLELHCNNLSGNLMLDRQKMLQIFLNLLSNACKFTHNGKIIFTVSSNSNSLNFSVKDTGIGISKEQLNYIFDEFTQVDGSQTRKFEGTGLGMAITKNFVDLMKGKISVESELNLGTTFTVIIPLSKNQS